MATRSKFTATEFFAATSGSEDRFELVDGSLRHIEHADQRCNVIRSNVLTALVPPSRRARCRATSVRTGVLTGPDTIRYPDVVVDRGPSNEAAMTAALPTIVVEVAGSVLGSDLGDRLREYQNLECVDIVLQIEAETILARVHRRLDDGAWSKETVDDLNASIHLPPLATSIAMADIYDTLRNH